jgi:hypothetical protein
LPPVHSAKSTCSNSIALPLINAVAFFIIVDLDVPRRGLIRVIPQNLNSLAQSLGP